MGVKELILGSLIWSLLIIILAVPISIFLTWKIVVILIVKISRKNWRVLGIPDVISTEGPEKNTINVGVACFVDGDIDIDEFRDHFSQIFLGTEEGTSSKLKYEKFHSNLVSFLGVQFAQVLPKIDVNSLIHKKTLGKDEVVEEALSEWILKKYPANSPLWEIILIPLNDKEETVFAIKIHHAFADGYSLAYVMSKLIDNSSQYFVKEHEETFIQKVSQMIQFPCHLRKFQAPDPRDNPFNCVLETRHRWSMAFVGLDMRILKKIRRHFDVQFGVLMSSLVASVLRRYLLETKPTEPLPPHFTMTNALAWPNHPSQLPDTPFTDRMCNHWTSGMMKIGVASDDPIIRLKESQILFQELQELGLSKFLKRFLVPLSWVFQSKAFFDAIAPKGLVGGFSSAISGRNNKLFGKSISKMFPLIVLSDLTPCLPLIVCTCSHGDQLDLSFFANPQHFPNQEVLNKIVQEYFPEEIEWLRILGGIMLE